MANIRLNILPVLERSFSFTVFRKLRPDVLPDRVDGVFLYTLPVARDGNAIETYLVSFLELEGFHEFQAHSSHSIGLTKHFLTFALETTLKSKAIGHETVRRLADERTEFIINEYPEGRQIISLSPYYFEEQKLYGFIIDFRFARNRGVPFTKKTQILSLSLDSAGRSNRNYYSDKFRLIDQFIFSTHDRIGTLVSPIPIHIGKQMIEATLLQLNKKEYIFNNNNTSNSQFQGIRNFGPLKKIIQEVLFVFIFEERFRSFANDLYLSLIGKTNPGTFPGLKAMFGIQIDTTNVRQIKIQGYSDEELISITKDVQQIQNENATKKVIGIYIEDYSLDEEDKTASDHYYFLKYLFIKNDIPLQVVNYRKLSEKNALKWSTSNLALAIFAKLGGIPWVVKPTNNDCLILGIGSAHSKNTDGHIKKYFAYTVCLDSSGLYKQLAVLAEETTESSYLEALTANLVLLLRESRETKYRTCVLHLPFKIKQREITAIKEAIQQIDDIQFVALKVNTDNKYFGFSYHNTLVPYESSFVKLSKSEYLVWFEGLLYGKEIVDKHLSNPVHIQFLNLQTEHPFDERAFLQDVLNLSGANWRGFNAKSIPISIYYSQIIAKYTQAFELIDGYEDGSISNDKPWFL
jgi:hypothetical protein